MYGLCTFSIIDKQHRNRVARKTEIDCGLSIDLLFWVDKPKKSRKKPVNQYVLRCIIPVWEQRYTKKQIPDTVNDETGRFKKAELLSHE